MMDIADQAMKNYEQALQASLKFQQEVLQSWGRSFGQTAGQEWQQRFSQLAGPAGYMMPVAQKRVEELLALVGQNNRTGAELMKKAVDAAQTPGVAESQAKWLDFWSSSMAAVRANTEAIGQMNTRAIDSCIELVRKSSESARAGKAA
jgi:hypothetical protein